MYVNVTKINAFFLYLVTSPGINLNGDSIQSAISATCRSWDTNFSL